LPGEAWFPSAYPFGRVVLILGFAVASCAVGVFGMGLYEETGLVEANDLPSLMRAALWHEQSDWLLVPSGCAIEDVLHGGEGADPEDCRVDLSFKAPWPPHHIMAHRTYCGRQYSGNKFLVVSDDSRPVVPRPSCLSILGRNCSQLEIGVEYSATCHVFREPPHALRMIKNKARSLKEVHAALDEIVRGFHGPIGAVEAQTFLHFSLVLLVVAVTIWCCDVITDKRLVRQRKMLLEVGEVDHPRNVRYVGARIGT